MVVLLVNKSSDIHDISLYICFKYSKLDFPSYIFHQIQCSLIALTIQTCLMYDIVHT